MKKRVTNGGVVRFGVSMPAEVAGSLDRWIREHGYANRSQALTDLVRDHLVDQFAADDGREIAGTITLIYDHHKRDLLNRLTETQHACEHLVISVLHVHLDHHHCMEVLAVRGRAGDIRHLADQLISLKGIIHGKLTVTATGKEFGKA